MLPDSFLHPAAASGQENKEELMLVFVVKCSLEWVYEVT
jgi:hypothetical protein